MIGFKRLTTVSFAGDQPLDLAAPCTFNLVVNTPLSPRTDVPALINGRMAHAPDDNLRTMHFGAKNITNEKYFRAGTGEAVYPSEPATYGIDFGVDF